MNGPLAHLDYSALAGFVAAAFIAVWSVVIVSGFLPRAIGPRAAQGPLGGLLVYCSAVAIMAVLAGMIITAPQLPWAVSIVISGIAILAAPFLVEPLPLRFRESKLGLLAVLGLCTVALSSLPNLFSI